MINMRFVLTYISCRWGCEIVWDRSVTDLACKAFNSPNIPMDLEQGKFAVVVIIVVRRVVTYQR